MKNTMKKLLSFVLVAVMLLSVVPFQAFADGEEGQLETAQGEPAVQNETPAENIVTDEDNGAVVFGLPSGVELGDAATVYFYIVDDDFDGSDSYILRKSPTKVGSSFPGFPSNASALELYAKLNSTSAGKGVLGWYWDEAGTEPVGSTSGLKVSDTEVCVYMLFQDVEQSVTLDAKGGKFAPGEGTIKVLIGQPYPDMPTPTRSGYIFDGWYVKDSGGSERAITPGETIVHSTAKPYAKWTSVGYTVTVMWYSDFDNGDASSWVEFDAKYTDMAIPTGSTISAATGTFPSSAEIGWQILPSGYTLKGWKFLETGKDFTPGSTKISESNANSSGEIIIVPRLQRTVTLIAQHPTKNTLSRQSITVEIGTAIGELPAPTSYAGDSNDDSSFTFTQWVGGDGTVISTRDDLKSTSKHPKYYPELSYNEDDHGVTHHFDAQWTESQVVVLYFHTGGNTNISKATKVICYDIPASGSFNMNSLNLYKYFPDYTKYDDNVDIRDGWYDATGWALYCQGKAAGTVCDELWNITDTRDLQELHIMLIDKGSDTSSGSGTSGSGTADSSNPKTGDTIGSAMVIMSISVAVLASACYVSKKRFAR